MDQRPRPRRPPRLGRAPLTTATLVTAALGGVLAGVLTTVAGIGGGLLLIALLTAFSPLEPVTAVAVAAPVLLVGNVQRLITYRDRVDRPLTWRFLLGSLPATAAGAVILPALPARAIRAAVAVLLLAFVAEQLRRWRTGPRDRALQWRAPLPAFTVIGAVSGAVTATVGGSGPLTAPFLHGRGLIKESFVGTSAACSAAEHAVKVAGYVAVGVLTTASVPVVAVATAGVVAGNVAGLAALGRVSEATFTALLLLVLALAAVRLLLP